MLLSYGDREAFEAGKVSTKVTLGKFDIAGTYFAALDGHIIGRSFGPDLEGGWPVGTTIDRWSAESGALETISEPFKNMSGSNWYGPFNWGGFSGPSVIADGKDLYVLGQVNEEVWEIAKIDEKLNVVSTADFKAADLGYAFIIKGTLYLGESFDSAHISYSFNLHSETLTSVDITLGFNIKYNYISDTVYDAKSDTLYLVNSGELFKIEHASTQIGDQSFTDSTDEDTPYQGSVATGEAVKYVLVGETPEGVKFDGNGEFAVIPLAADQALGTGQSRVVSFQYFTTDGKTTSVTHTVSITINGVNDAPEAVGLSDHTTEDDAYSGQVSGSDAENAGLTYSLVGVAPEGVSFNSDGTFTVSPLAADQALGVGESRSVSFQFVAHDGAIASAAETVTIAIAGANDAPVADADSVGSTEDSITTGSVAGNVSDPDDGAILTYSLDTPIAGLTLASDGSFSFDDGNAAYQHLGAGETVTLAAHYTVSDEHQSEAQSILSLTVTGLNDAPISDGYKGASIAENAAAGTVVGQMTAHDIDGDAIHYSLGDDAGGRFVIDAETGVVSVADGAVLDFETKQLWSIVVRASDGAGGWTEETAKVRLTNVFETLSGTENDDSLRAPSKGGWQVDGLGGDDVLADTGSNDILVGGSGNDTYYVRFSTTAASELDGQGADRVIAFADYQLADNLEALALRGSADVGIGNSRNNAIMGAGNDDRLEGQGGADTLRGFGGNDTLDGGSGRDVMVGGDGADQFRFDALTDSSVNAAGRDRIVQFSANEGDRIDVSLIDAVAGGSDDAFSVVSAFHRVAGELRVTALGTSWLIAADTDGDGKGDFGLQVGSSHALTAADFIL